MRIPDISEWQGRVDWAQVQPHIDGVMLRAGYGKGHADARFAENAAACDARGIPMGAYWFSYAATAEEARAEAQCLLTAVRPYPVALPLAFDFEYDSVQSAARRSVTVTKALATELARAFCEEIERGGHWAVFYANPDYLARYYDEALPQRFGLWLAQWPGGTPDLSAPPRECAMWQWTSRAALPGVTGDVDMSEGYVAALPPAPPVGRVVPDAPPAAPQDGALAWARAHGIVSAPDADAPATLGDLARALHHYHRAFGAKEAQT